MMFSQNVPNGKGSASDFRKSQESCNPDGVCRILGVGTHGTSSGKTSEGQGSVADQSHPLDTLRYVCLFDFNYLLTLCKLSYLVFF